MRDSGRSHGSRRACIKIDACDYFDAFQRAAREARSTLHIMAWCVHRCVVLDRESGDEVRLGDLLLQIRRERPELKIRILCWNLSFLYATASIYQTIDNLRFWWDEGVEISYYGLVPPGASHHEKLVVVDDRLAFIGGLDLCAGRWDRPVHAPGEELRCDLGQEGYPPFHDVQLMLEGDIAHALGDFFRERWHVATGRRIHAPAGISTSPWPEGECVDAMDIRFAIERTVPEGTPMGPVIREIEEAYIDTIRHARKFLYIENQYFTAEKVCEALKESLDREEGPEVVVVTNAESASWLEHYAMGRLRDRRIRALKQCRGAGRFRVYTPRIPLKDGERFILHTKLLVADAVRGILGSANLNDRSMAFDTELALSWAEEDGALARKLTVRLLAEHLDVTSDTVEEAWSRTGSLIRTIDDLAGNERTLEILEPGPESDESDIVDPSWLDPRDPDALLNLVQEALPAEAGRRGHRPFLTAARIGFLLLGAVLARDLGLLPIETDALDQVIDHSLGSSTFARASVLTLLYVVGLGLQVPSSILATLVFLVVPFLPGILCITLGSVLAALLGRIAGKFISGRHLKKWFAVELRRISRRLAGRHPLWGFLWIRLIPSAPHVLQDLAAGRMGIAAHVQLGTAALTPLPMALVTGLLVDRARALAEEFRLIPFVQLVLISSLAALMAAGIRRYLRRASGVAHPG